jgi:uncharacterized protein (DUF302 family)
MNAATDIRYGHVVEVDQPFPEAVEAVKAALLEEGFKISSTIDMAAQAKERLGKEFRPYIILGACNAQLADLALSAEPQLGLLLPCNVVVQEIEGRTIVSAIDASAIVQFAANRSLEHIAADANARLLRALKSLVHRH